MTCFTKTCQFCVPTIVKVSLKIFFGVAVVLCWSFSPESYYLRHWTSICTQGTLLGGRVEDHRMKFARHLHNTTIMYSRNTISDYMMSLTIYTPTSVCISSIVFYIHLLMCLQGDQICLKIKKFFSWLSFPLFSWPYCLIQGWYWKEKLDASYS